MGGRSGNCDALRTWWEMEEMVEVRLAGPLWHCAAWLVFAAGETSTGVASPRSFGATFCSFPPRLLRLRLAIHYNIHDSDLSMPGGHVLERFV